VITIIVPARGESKGLPGKNLALVGGVSLVGRAVLNGLEALSRIGEEGRIVCSTDDTAIAGEARSWGAEVPFLRPPELASDDARSMDVVLHALSELGVTDGPVILLQPTSPLASPEDVIEGLRIHRESGDPVVSVCTVDHPVEWTFRLGSEGRLNRLGSKQVPSRRQDSAGVVQLNGAVYVADAAWLTEHQTFVSDRTRAFSMPAERSVDVDTEHDLAEARRMIESQCSPVFSLGTREIGIGKPVFVIAEAGVNHNGDLGVALRLVDVAVDSGADAVKFQTFRSESIISETAPMAEYQRRNVGHDETQLEMARRLEMDERSTRAVRDHCRSRNIMFLSTPFDEVSADLLESLGVPAFKVGSGELTNHRFLKYLAQKNLPLLVSTGMSNLQEVAAAVRAIRSAGDPPLCLLHCVSNYPADPEDSNLAAMRTMREAFGCPVGWSDHTLGIHVSLAAVALGASVIERHYTLDRSMPGPDHRASLEPGELRDLVRQIRDVEVSLGDGEKTPRESERHTADVARRSLHASRDIEDGQRITAEDLTILRPGTGIPADRFDEIVGRRACRRMPSGAMISESDLE
jgi:N-acetylneuraminate synthase